MIKKVLLFIKLSKLVKNGRNIFYFLSPIFGQIAYFRGIKVGKKFKNWGKKSNVP